MDFPIGFHRFAKYLKFTRIVYCGFYSEHAAFVIHLDAVGLQLEFLPAAHGAVFVVGDCLSLKPRIRFAPHEGENIGACKIVECVAYQRWIDILEETAFLKHDIGSELALVHAPAIALSEGLINSIKEGVNGLRKGIEPAAQFGRVKLVS